MNALQNIRMPKNTQSKLSTQKSEKKKRKSNPKKIQLCPGGLCGEKEKEKKKCLYKYLIRLHN